MYTFLLISFTLKALISVCNIFFSVECFYSHSVPENRTDRVGRNNANYGKPRNAIFRVTISFLEGFRRAPSSFDSCFCGSGEFRRFYSKSYAEFTAAQYFKSAVVLYFFWFSVSAVTFPFLVWIDKFSASSSRVKTQTTSLPL